MKNIYLIKYSAVFLLVFFFSVAIADYKNMKEPIFPNLSGKNLNGKQYNLPKDLPSEKTLVLIAFEREQQAILDSWYQGLDLINSSIPWIEVPVISKPYKLGSFIIDSGMRRGIPNPRVRDKVITLYTNREAFAHSMGFEYDNQAAYVAVIDRSGKNLGIVKGSYDQDKAKKILKLLDMK